MKGTPITGALTADAAEIPTLEPGQWVDTFLAKDLSPIDWNGETGGNDASFRYYRLDIPEGYRAHVTATLVVPAGGGKSGQFTGVQTALRGQGGAECAKVRTYGASGVDTVMPLVAAASADCEGPLLVELRRDGTARPDLDLSVEILVRLEPPADASGLPGPEKRPGPDAPAQDADGAEGIEGGASFNSAAELSPGQTYSSMIGTGEVKFFKVRLEWGQQMSFSPDFARRLDGPDARMNVVRTTVHSPVRERVSSAATDLNGVWHVNKNVPSQNIHWSTPEPVRYGSDGYGMDGYYYISLADHSADREFVLDEYLITVDVAGEPEEDPRYLVAEDPTPGPSAPPEPSSAEEAGAAEPGEASALPWVVGGVVAAAAGAGVFLVRRRKGAHGTGD